MSSRRAAPPERPGVPRADEGPVPQEELRSLRERLAEAEETLRAIREGEVDALVVRTEGTERIFTLKGAETPYRVFVEEMVEGAATLGSDLTILYCNRRFSELAGVPLEHLIGRSIDTVVDGPGRIGLRELLDEAATGTAKRELCFGGEHGRRTPVFVSVARVPLDDAHRLSVIVTDLTEQKRHEELAATQRALRESESRLRELADTLPIIVWAARPDGEIDYFNRRWHEYTGAPEGAVKSPGSALHPDDAARYSAEYQRATASGEPYEIEYRLRQNRTGAYRWHLGRAVPVRDASGLVRRWYGTCVDIQQIVEARETLTRGQAELEQLVASRTAELRDSHQRLRATERMASLGTLAAGLGHDLANLLLPIRMRLDAIECPGEKGAAAEDIGAIREALKYLQRLSEGMRLLAQDPESGSGTNEALEIRAWWRDVERVIRSVVPREIELNADIPDVPLRVPVARHRLTQAVFNLVQNSVEAMSGRGSGRVQVWAKRLSAESSAAGAPAVQVGVTDDGPGMSGEVLARCFEPYFSTKGRAISTGMGLGLVRAVVERSGGKIIATSTPNQATTFVLEFPESVGPDRSGASGRHGAPRAAVALVEGRTSAHARMILRSFGFDVTEGPPQRAPSPPVLWLTDRAEIDSLADFVRDSSSRHVLVYDSGSGARQGIAAESSRVVYLGRNPSPSVVRAAISRVVNAIEKPSIES